MKLKRKYFKKCTACEGVGKVWHESMDSYGDTVRHEFTCTICCGEGVVFSSKLYKKLRGVLSI